MIVASILWLQMLVYDRYWCRKLVIIFCKNPILRWFLIKNGEICPLSISIKNSVIEQSWFGLIFGIFLNLCTFYRLLLKGLVCYLSVMGIFGPEKERKFFFSCKNGEKLPFFREKCSFCQWFIQSLIVGSILWLQMLVYDSSSCRKL